MGRNFVMQMQIGPLYEPWTFDPDKADRQFEKGPDDSYRSGWRIYDPYIGREITNPFRVEMYVDDTFFLGVASWDRKIEITRGTVEFIPRHDTKSKTPFHGGRNPWKELPSAIKARNPGRGYSVWDWDGYEDQPIVAEGLWDIVATVTIESKSGGEYRFGFDPRMCVGGVC